MKGVELTLISPQTGQKIVIDYPEADYTNFEMAVGNCLRDESQYLCVSNSNSEQILPAAVLKNSVIKLMRLGK